MFDLNLQYINQADREQRIEAGLRRRQLQQVVDDAAARDRRVSAVAPTPAPRRTVGPVRAFGR